MKTIIYKVVLSFMIIILPISLTVGEPDKA